MNYNTDQSVIYKISCNDKICEYVYIGSTTDFKERLWKHKSCCNNENGKGYNCNVYKTIRDNGGFDNWTMSIIEIYPCNSRQELHVREQYYIEQQVNKINSRNSIPNPNSYREYYVANRDMIMERHKKYNSDHRDQTNKNQRERHHMNRDEINEKRRERYQMKKEQTQMAQHDK